MELCLCNDQASTPLEGCDQPVGHADTRNAWPFIEGERLDDAGICVQLSRGM